jgi:uncharacterized protein DUF4153
MTKTIAGSALLLAILFELVIYGEHPGIGFLIFWLASVVATLFLLRNAERLRPDRLWMFLPSLLVAFSLFRYDAFILRVWGSALCLLFLAWAMAWNLLSEWHPDVLSRLFPTGTYSPVKLGSNAKESLRVECHWESEKVVQVLRGMILATGLLMVFGTLLANADAVFGAKLESLFNGLGLLSPAPGVRILFWLALAGGAIRLWLLAPPCEAAPTRSAFQPTELFIALGSLNGLLTAFLLMHGAYLFGDASLVEALGLSYAQYARRGFFELTLCIGLLLPLVLIAYRAAEVRNEPRLRYLGGGLILSAIGLAVSAIKRMFLYIDAYGLSVERFYAAVGIFVAMGVLMWAAYCCFQPRPIPWLLARQKVTVIILLSLLALVNVDAIVARSHLRLVEQGKMGLDAGYLSNHLSADALPVLKEFREKLPQHGSELILIHQRIAERCGNNQGPSFNISRFEISRSR